jgi:hypothetical protein
MSEIDIEIFEQSKEEPIKVKKEKVKREMSMEKKAELLERLRNGKKKAKLARESKKNQGKIQEEKKIVEVAESVAYHGKPIVVQNESILSELDVLKKELKQLKDNDEKREIRKQIKELKKKNEEPTPRPSQPIVSKPIVSKPIVSQPIPIPSKPIPIPQKQTIKKSLFASALW